MSVRLCFFGPSLLGLLVVRSSNLLVLGVNIYWVSKFGDSIRK